MQQYLVQIANSDNPLEVIDQDKLEEIDMIAEQYDGFNPIYKLIPISEKEANYYKTQDLNNQTQADREAILRRYYE